MSSATARITFQPDGETLETPVGSRLLKVVLGTGRPIGYSCRGQGVCTACVLWVSGDVSPISPPEQALLDRLGPSHSTSEGQQRIACFARINGDVTVRADYW